MNDKQIKIIGDIGSHDALRSMLRAEKKGRVLDVPCGQGILSGYLEDLGFDVVAADIDAGNFRLDNIEFEPVNLNTKLPFEDESFDMVVCANGIHRVFNYGGAIEEFNRVLKPGGVLFLNVNNYSSALVRMRFLLTGSLNNSVNTGAAQQTITEPEAHVRNAIVFPQIALSLERNDFSIAEIRSSNVKIRHRLMLPVAVLIKLLAMLLPKQIRHSNFVGYTNSMSLLIGGYYCVKLIKND